MKEMSSRKRRILAFVTMLSILLTIMMPGFSLQTQAAKSKLLLSQTSATLRKGDTVTLTVRGTTKEPAWGSDNIKVATVSDNGVVKALRAGNARIYGVVDGRVVICKISVSNAYTWKYNGHKYQIIEKGMKWSAAKKYCESIGGHLAVITSEGEQEALVKALRKYGKRNNYWLGAKKNSAGSFKWVNREKFEYEAFAGGMPDRDYEKCLMIYRYDNPNTAADDSYRWNDLVNEGTFGTEAWFGLQNFGMVCEWD